MRCPHFGQTASPFFRMFPHLQQRTVRVLLDTRPHLLQRLQNLHHIDIPMPSLKPSVHKGLAWDAPTFAVQGLRSRRRS